MCRRGVARLRAATRRREAVRRRRRGHSAGAASPPRCRPIASPTRWCCRFLGVGLYQGAHSNARAALIDGGAVRRTSLILTWVTYVSSGCRWWDCVQFVWPRAGAGAQAPCMALYPETRPDRPTISSSRWAAVASLRPEVTESVSCLKVRGFRRCLTVLFNNNSTSRKTKVNDNTQRAAGRPCSARSRQRWDRTGKAGTR